MGTLWQTTTAAAAVAASRLCIRRMIVDLGSGCIRCVCCAVQPVSITRTIRLEAFCSVLLTNFANHLPHKA